MKEINLKDDCRIIDEISDIILGVANLYNAVTTSDLQGIATVKALEIILKAREYIP